MKAAPALVPVAIAPTRDIAYIDSVVRSPDVWPWIKDDATPAPEDVTLAAVLTNRESHFLRVDRPTGPAGWIGFFEIRPCVYELHTNLTRRCRGRHALEAGWLAVAWLFQHTAAQSIETYVFETALPSRLMMKAAGWPELKREPHPHTVDGRRVERIWYHYTRAEWIRR